MITSFVCPLHHPLDPPSAPSLQVSEVTFSYVRLSWATPADQIVTGYILHFKRESGDWEELRLPDGTSFMHEALRCGTRYQYYLVGFNSAGKGDPSQVVSARTDGTCKCATLPFSIFFPVLTEGKRTSGSNLLELIFCLLLEGGRICFA